MSKAIPPPPSGTGAPTLRPLDAPNLRREVRAAPQPQSVTVSPVAPSISVDAATAIGAAKAKTLPLVGENKQSSASERLRGVLSEAGAKVTQIVDLCAAGRLDLPQAKIRIDQCLNQVLARPQVRANFDLHAVLSRFLQSGTHSQPNGALAAFAESALKNPTDFAYGAVKGIAKAIDRLQHAAREVVNPLADQVKEAAILLDEAAVETAKDFTDAARGFVDGVSPLPGQPPLGPAYNRAFPYAVGHTVGATTGIVGDAAAIASGIVEIGGGGAGAVVTVGAATPVSAAAIAQGAALIAGGVGGFSVHGPKLAEPFQRPAPLEARAANEPRASGQNAAPESTSRMPDSEAVEARRLQWKEFYGPQEIKHAPERGRRGERIIAPKTLTAFPDAERMRSKTSVQGGGSLRARWRDRAGNIYEWDSRHGMVEKYNKAGKHVGEFDPETGAQTKPPQPIEMER